MPELAMKIASSIEAATLMAPHRESVSEIPNVTAPPSTDLVGCTSLSPEHMDRPTSKTSLCSVRALLTLLGQQVGS